MKRIEIIPIEGLPFISEGDDIAKLIYDAAEAQGTPIRRGDIIIVAQKIVSKSEGRVVNFKDVKPERLALRVAEISRKPPKIVDLALKESRSIVKLTSGHLITETRQGWIFSCSGVDISNVSGGDRAVLLPEDPDRSAQKIRSRLKELLHDDVAVLITDTSGRPFRKGDTDLTIGSAGLSPIIDLKGRNDLYGYRLKLKKVAVVDELASAAELVMGQCDEGVPAAIIRGYKYISDSKSSSKIMQRSLQKDLFISSNILHI